MQGQGLESRPGNQEVYRHGREEGQRQRGRLSGKPEDKIQAEPRGGRIGAVVAIKGLLAGSELCEPRISGGSSRGSKFSQCCLFQRQPWSRPGVL